MKYKQRSLFYLYLILFFAFAGFAVLAGIFSAPLYKNLYIQKHGEETLAKLTGYKYDHSSGSDSDISTDYYAYTYEFEIDGKTYSGKTTGRYTTPFINNDNSATYYIKIKYLPNGDSCAADYSAGNEIAAAVASYIMSAIAIIPLYFMFSSIIGSFIARSVLLYGKESNANFISMSGGLLVGKKSYYRIIYGFDFPNKGYKKVKTPYIYTYEEVQSVINNGLVTIKYNHQGRSAIALDAKKLDDKKKQG